MVPDEQKRKVFRDSVHGYISVPDSYCRLFIDTPLFQRLRHIEQTSMRVLYPSAHHDRFAHSLGTYHLGCMAFASLERNAKSKASKGASIPQFRQSKWESWRHTFQIACLMHDCGHAPFSHTFEKYYDWPKPCRPLVNRLLRASGLSVVDIGILPTTEHEIVSAILVLEKYRGAISEIEQEVKSQFSTAERGAVVIDPVLIARMITGLDYSNKTTDEQRFESCLIKLLNGRAIDVDKLDYIIRDTWASGCDNTSIDTQRLLSAVSIGFFGGGLVLAFEKSALSVIQSVVAARNYLYRWIYSHHKVAYDTWLLDIAVKALHAEFGYTEEDPFLSDLFSIAALVDSQTIDGRVFSLVADCDLMHYLKKYAHANPGSEASEWLSRQHSRRALWKSYAEYCLLFPRIVTGITKANMAFKSQFMSLLSKYEIDNGKTLKAISIPVQPKQISIDSGSVYINMPSDTVPYSNIEKVGGTELPPIPEFFYVYISKDEISQTDDILAFITRSM